MNKWLIPCLAMVVMLTANCSTPSDPDPVVPTATPVPTQVAGATATSTPTSGVIVLPTATPVPTPSGATYTVKYEVIASATDMVQVTYLDNVEAHTTSFASGTWDTTVTMDSGYNAQLVCAYLGTLGTPTVTVNIYVDTVLKATETRSGMVPAFTTEYWLP